MKHDTQLCQAVGRLRPQEIRTLRGLLDGLSEKEIAADRGMPRQAIHHHVRTIYRIFGVHSRSELLAKWIDRQAVEACTADESSRDM